MKFKKISDMYSVSQYTLIFSDISNKKQILNNSMNINYIMKTCFTDLKTTSQ